MLAESVTTTVLTVLAAAGIAIFLPNVLELDRTGQLIVETIVITAVIALALPLSIPVALFIGMTTALGVELLKELFYRVVVSLVLRGAFGQSRRWTAELLLDNDNIFCDAYGKISARTLREVEVIADSKEEFRDLTVERAQEQD